MDPTLEAFLDAVRARVEHRLLALFDDAEAFVLEHAPDARPMVSASRDLTLRGGKRLRPALLLAAVACVGPEEHPSAGTELGVALELLQSYLLIHDDWMDGDRLRRGAPSVHAALGDHYRDEHLGACTAILAGDLLAALTRDLVAGLDLPTERRRAVWAAFSLMEREVVLGQCLDVTHSPDTDRIHRLKTGSYTVRGPLRLGLALAGGSPELHAALDAFAGPLGLAFQLRDDVLGTYGAEAVTGKPVGGDLREGKRTALVTHALSHLDAERADALRAILGRRDATREDITRAQGLLDASGAREHVEARIARLRDECLGALGSPSLAPTGRALLSGLALRITERVR